jgi:FdhD protein
MPAEEQAPAATLRLSFQRIGANGTTASIERQVAVERPVAIEFNGIGYAVLMATPEHLLDLVFGFALTERLIDRAEDLLDVDRFERPEGTLLRATLHKRCAERVLDRVRHRVSESGCGLCGVENLEQALRPLPRLDPCDPPADEAVFKALAALDGRQPLNEATGAIHAAAACTTGGAIRLVREDVGRHNAFDKLLGAMMRDGLDWEGGFALLSSRCSYELVEKAVLSRCPSLVTISGPTTLAIERAKTAGLHLIVLARRDAMLNADDCKRISGQASKRTVDSDN